MATTGRVREAIRGDKAAILAINPDTYDGTDYLPDHFDHMMDSPSFHPYVYEQADGEIVGFVAICYLDGGSTAVDRAGRVSPQCQGQGVYRRLLAEINDILLRSESVTRKAMTTLPKTSESFKTSYKLVLRKLVHSYLLDPGMNGVRQRVQSYLPTSPLTTLTKADLSEIISSETLTPYLFPRKRLVVDFVPFRLLQENIPLMFGLRTKFLSSQRLQGPGEPRGILSACSLFHTTSSPFTANIDIFGKSKEDTIEHLATHLENIYQETNSITHIRILTDDTMGHDAIDGIMKLLGISKLLSQSSFTEISLYEGDIRGTN